MTWRNFTPPFDPLKLRADEPRWEIAVGGRRGARGLGLSYEYGSTGTTLGDPRKNMHLYVTLFLWRPVKLIIVWKGRP